MTQLTEHAKTILLAIADGKQLQDRPAHGSTVWLDCKLPRVMFLVAHQEWDMLRIAPETRSINGVTFAAPMEKELRLAEYELRVNDTTYYFAAREDGYKAAKAIIDALEGKTK